MSEPQSVALLAILNAAFERGEGRVAFAALDALSPRDRVEAYDGAQRHAYWTRKDLARVRAISRAGIGQAFALADEADDPADADHFRGRAKTLAYNLASFTWPGWDEPGVAPTPDDIADGREAARLNLRLAILLGRPDKVLADAHWLLGAHAIAAGDLATAATEFFEARALAAGTDEPTKVAMLEAYAALVASLADPTTADRFEAAVAAMRAAGNAGGAAYADQLVTARRVFVRAAR